MCAKLPRHAELGRRFLHTKWYQPRPRTRQRISQVGLEMPQRQHMFVDSENSLHVQAHVVDRVKSVSQAMEHFFNGTLTGQRPRGMMNGDLIMALVGGFEPFVLRPARVREHFDGEVSRSCIHDGEEYCIVGTCYLEGAMNGEILKERNWLG
jgi:hypothetical protein